MQPFYQNETFAVLPHPGRVLQSDLKDALGISRALLEPSVARRFTDT
jgi:hypothetical protein